PPPPTTMLYTLSLHDALPISGPPTARPSRSSTPRPSSPTASPCWAASASSPLPRTDPDEHDRPHRRRQPDHARDAAPGPGRRGLDRKSTRLNSSHVAISYAVF